tara:strand:- start:1466 stop:1951 length:486 start_codon:yes stop_codon:yes gene_type:complete
MQNKKYTKQRIASIQGLRSFKDTLPKKIKRVIDKKGHIFSEILSNWRYLVGDNFFKICYPKSFKNHNKINVSTLIVMLKRGHEVELEYSKKDIINKINSFFGYEAVEKLKFLSFDEEKEISSNIFDKAVVTNKKYEKKLQNVKNEKIKKSLLELTKVYKKK